MAIFLFQDGGWRPSWILIQVKNGVTARCGLPMSTTMPNVVTVHQPAAELLRFVKKFKMAASAILNLYLAILDHPRSSLTALKSHRKFGINRTFTFQDIAILKFWKFGLKCLFRPPKFTFFGVLTLKCYFSLLRPPKGTSLARNTPFEPSMVAVWRAVRPGRWAKNTKNTKRVAQNVRPKFGCLPRRPRWTDLYQILHAGSCPGCVS